MRRQRLTLMILEINIKYKILSKQFFLILGGGPSVCLVCHVGNPVPERGVQGPPPPPAPQLPPGKSQQGAGQVYLPRPGFGPVSVSLGVTRRTGTRRGGRESRDRAPAKGG